MLRGTAVFKAPRRKTGSSKYDATTLHGLLIAMQDSESFIDVKIYQLAANILLTVINLCNGVLFPLSLSLDGA